jgi:hypothetical protein
MLQTPSYLVVILDTMLAAFWLRSIQCFPFSIHAVRSQLASAGVGRFDHSCSTILRASFAELGSRADLVSFCS